jgi:hypothetical protein
LIRLIVDQVDRAIDLLAENDYLFDIFPVIALYLKNQPGELARTAGKFGEEQINIKYVYGSVAETEGKVLFIFCPEDIEQADRVFQEDEAP